MKIDIKERILQGAPYNPLHVCIQNIHIRKYV